MSPPYGGLVMKAKFYERKDRPGRFVVELWWKGKRYRRHHYDEDVPLVHIEMARQVTSAINADIKQKRKAFDPRQWFRSADFEFQFSKFADLWLTRNISHYAPSVKRDVARTVDLFKAHFGKTDIREIRKSDITAFLEALPQHFKPKTKHDALSRLHVLFQYAKDEELLSAVPGFPAVEVPDSEVKWTTREWQDKILAEIPERDRPIFIFLAAWGCRPGEARALMWDSVDFDKKVVTIRRTFSGAGCNHLQEYTKTKKIRYLPFTEELETIFKRIRGIGGFVFRNAKGRPYTSDISRIWNEARDKVGCPDKVTLNQGTRHSFATQHLDKLDLVSLVLGHTSTNTTRHKYQGINVDKIREIVK
jgi:integrase